MRFSCERDALANLLTTAGRASTKRTGALPVLGGIHLSLADGLLTVTGTDLELTVRSSIEVAGELDGECVVPARLAADIVRSLPAGKVTVEVPTVDGARHEMKFAAGRTKFSVNCLSVEDWPRMATDLKSDADVAPVTMSAAVLAEALRRVAPAASTDDSRPLLTGVLMAAEAGSLRLVATDSYRLAVCDLAGVTVLDGDRTVLVPARAFAELVRVLGSKGDVTLVLGERSATFMVGAVSISTRLIEGAFPNYRQLIPTGWKVGLGVERGEFTEALKRVKLLARDATPVSLKMSEGQMVLSASTQDVGLSTETIDAAIEGDDLAVSFNPDYLLAGLECVGGETARFELTSSLKPAVLRAENFLYLLMPVRVPGQ
jgi:DNA polymerase-3 subunit beta